MSFEFKSPSIFSTIDCDLPESRFCRFSRNLYIAKHSSDYGGEFYDSPATEIPHRHGLGFLLPQLGRRGKSHLPVVVLFARTRPFCDCCYA